MPIRIGYMPNPAKPLLPQIRKAKRLGADYAEIVLETQSHPDAIARDSAKIRKELEKCGLACTIHMAYWADLGSEYEAVREGWVKECKKAITAARMIRAEKFLVHARQQSGASMSLPMFKKPIIAGMISSFNELSRFAARNSIRLVIENEFFGERFSPADMKAIARKVRGAGIALDAGHAYIGGSNKSVAGLIRMLGSRIEHCHFSDNKGREDDHLAIGRGKINYQKAVKELKRAGFGSDVAGTRAAGAKNKSINRSTITLETFNSGDRGFSASAKKVRKMWG